MQTPEELLEQIRSEDESVEESDAIPPITKLTVDVRGTRGKRYQGEFIYKVPTLADQISIGRLKNEYLPQGGASDANAAILVEQICYLAVTLQDPKPEWWKPFELYDAAPVGALYGEALTYERRFHGGAADDSEVRSKAESDELHEEGGSEAVRDVAVGRKVQPPAKRRETLVAHSEGSR